MYRTYCRQSADCPICRNSSTLQQEVPVIDVNRHRLGVCLWVLVIHSFAVGMFDLGSKVTRSLGLLLNAPANR